MATVDEINALFRADTLDVDALGAALDAADADTRLAATRKWSKSMQRALFDAAEGRGVTSDQVVPTTEVGQEVIHRGTNTLPMFRQFQKRFCRVEGEDGIEISGYNHNPDVLMWATTPGYYVAYEDPDSPEFVIDYRQMPDQKAETWPPIVKNSKRLGLVVYAGMVDRLRRVSEHVTIGRAYKKKPMSAWFVLVRDDASYPS